MQRDMQLYLRKLKELKQTLPITGGYWLEERNGLLLGHYEGPEGKALGVFDLCGQGAGRCGGRTAGRRLSQPSGRQRDRKERAACF